MDPNTNLTLWESGAIIQYLEEVYDTEKKLTYDSLTERQLLNQYLHFQMSGQGPYFGQAGWYDRPYYSLVFLWTNHVSWMLPSPPTISSPACDT